MTKTFPERTKFKRYVSVPSGERQTLTLPRKLTAPQLKQDNVIEDKPELNADSKDSKESEASENGADTRIDEESASVVADRNEESTPEVTKPRQVTSRFIV